MKYLLMLIVIAIGILAIITPDTKSQPYYMTPEEKLYGKKPVSFAKHVRESVKYEGKKIKDVKCFNVVASKKYNGWISSCRYFVPNAFGGSDVKNDRFVINLKIPSIRLIRD